MFGLAVVGGVLGGFITGITPGLHANLAASLAVSAWRGAFSGADPLDVAVFIIAMATAHTVLDVVPSIFLGAPSEAFAIAMLPGHQLLRQGAGYEGVRLAAAGSVIAAGIALLLSPLLWFIVPWLSGLLTPWISFILICIMIFLMLKEKGWLSKGYAVSMIVASGALGLFALRWIALYDPLMPLLSGLFGAASLVLALGEESCIPPQFITESILISKRRQAVLIACAVFSGWMVSFLPGVGSGQAAVLSTILLPSLAAGEYLYVVGGIGTVNFVLSIMTAATIHKARNGAIAVILEIIPVWGWKEALVLSAAALVSVGMAGVLALMAGKCAAKLARKVPYKFSCVMMIGFVFVVVAVRSGILGIVVYMTGAALGVLCSLAGVARHHLMACLIVPVILYSW